MRNLVTQIFRKVIDSLDSPVTTVEAMRLNRRKLYGGKPGDLGHTVQVMAERAGKTTNDLFALSVPSWYDPCSGELYFSPDRTEDVPKYGVPFSLLVTVKRDTFQINGDQVPRDAPAEAYDVMAAGLDRFDYSYRRIRKVEE